MLVTEPGQILFTLQEKPSAVDDLPLWNYDGSSCGQAPGDDSEVMLRPVKIYPVSYCMQ